MQLERLADAQPAVRCGEVVKQEQLARTEQNALLDRIQVKPPLGEVGSLLGSSTSRSFDCGDIHSGAGSEGSGVASVSEPLCHHGAHLVLRVTPTLNFEEQSLTPFTLKGPC